MSVSSRSDINGTARASRADRARIRKWNHQSHSGRASELRRSQEDVYPKACRPARPCSVVIGRRLMPFGTTMRDCRAVRHFLDERIRAAQPPGQPALRPDTRPSILDLVEERRLGLVGMVIWSVVLLSAAGGIGFGVWLSLQRWMLIPPGAVLSALSARILLAAPPRLLWRRTSAVSARPAIPAK